MGTLTTLAQLIVTLYGDAFVEALTMNTFLLTRLSARGNVKTGRGKGIDWPVRYAGNTAVGSYGEGEAAGGANQQAAKMAGLTWRFNRAEISVSGQALAVGATGGILVDPLRFELDNGLRDMRVAINTQVMSDGTGNSGKDITGLQAAIADTGTYAGIDRSADTWWKAYINANSGTPRALAESQMRDVKGTIEDRGGMVSAIYTSSAQWYAYGDLLVAERRQTPTTLTGGYQALDYEGVPVIKIPGYPSARMDFLNEDHCEYQVLPVSDGSVAGLRNVIAVPGVPGFGILILGATRDSVDFWAIHYSQTVLRNPYLSGSVQDLS